MLTCGEVLRPSDGFLAASSRFAQLWDFGNDKHTVVVIRQSMLQNSDDGKQGRPEADFRLASGNSAKSMFVSFWTPLASTAAKMEAKAPRISPRTEQHIQPLSITTTCDEVAPGMCGDDIQKTAKGKKAW
eukprot:3310449-Pleurochrysis_carterae.AAC.1